MRKEDTVTIDLLHRAVPARYTDEGLRALSGESPTHAGSVQKYPEGKFGDALEDVLSHAGAGKIFTAPPAGGKNLCSVRKVQAGDSSRQKRMGGLRQAGPGPHP